MKRARTPTPSKPPAEPTADAPDRVQGPPVPNTEPEPVAAQEPRIWPLEGDRWGWQSADDSGEAPDRTEAARLAMGRRRTGATGRRRL